MEVIGIDVGPGKGGHVCDGERVRRMEPAKLESYLKNELPENELPENVLVAWDAPLTGPRDPDNPCANKRDLTTRKIESFFRKGGDLDPPDGITTLRYGSCSHWTISRALLGLPRVGPYDAKLKQLPFALVTDDQDQPRTGRHIVEVHPAVAIWRYCKTHRSEGALWQYKGSKKKKATLVELAKLMSCCIKIKRVADADHDELDAWTAWYLAHRWLNNSDVMLLGNAQDGSFLLPREQKLKTDFAKFVSGS